MFNEAVKRASTGPDLLRNRETGNYSWQGMPFRGRTPKTLKKDDPQYRQPQYKTEVHIKQFALDDDEDMAEYQRIFQDVSDGKAVISFEEKVYDPEIKTWRVLLRWFDVFYQASDNEPAGMEEAE